MGEVINYANNKAQCFCQVKLDNGERVLVSIASVPSPSIKLIKLGRLGVLPKETIWEYSAEKAGGVDEYVNEIIHILGGPTEEMNHPLDSFRDKLLSLESVEAVKEWLVGAQRRIIT